jgi:hypothetical protein
MSVNVACDQAGVRAQIRHGTVGQAPGRVPFESTLLPQDRRGACRDRLRDELSTIARFTRIGDKRIAALYRTAVSRKPADAKSVERTQVRGGEWRATRRVFEL